MSHRIHATRLIGVILSALFALALSTTPSTTPASASTLPPTCPHLGAPCHHVRPLTFMGHKLHPVTVLARTGLHTYVRTSGIGLQTILTRQGGMCIGIAGASNILGVPVKQGYCNNAPDQKWNIVVDDSAGCTSEAWAACWMAINQNSHLCIDFLYNRHTNGDPIVQWYCDPTDHAVQLGFAAAGGEVGGDCNLQYEWIAHGAWTYSNYYMAVPGGHATTPIDLVEWFYGGTPPSNATFWNFPGGGC